MRARFLRLALAGLTLMLLPLAGVSAASAQPASNQARIDQAVEAYAAKLQADQNKARDRLVYNHRAQFLGDPMSPVIGNPKADVAIVEFFDYTCPYCKAVEPRLEALLKADKGVKLILKEFPILTPASLVATRVAFAAVKQGKYKEFHQALMNFRGRLTDDVIFDTAKDVGLDVARLRKDMTAPEINDEIIANFNLARAVRVFQTPTFIVDNHVLTGPSADIDFPKVVAAARANAH